MNEPTFSTAEVSRILGVPTARLHYWSFHGYIPTQPYSVGTGARRVWTQSEVLRLRVCLNMVHGATEIIEKWRSGALWRGE